MEGALVGKGLARAEMASSRWSLHDCHHHCAHNPVQFQCPENIALVAFETSLVERHWLRSLGSAVRKGVFVAYFLPVAGVVSE